MSQKTEESLEKICAVLLALNCLPEQKAQMEQRFPSIGGTFFLAFLVLLVLREEIGTGLWLVQECADPLQVRHYSLKSASCPLLLETSASRHQ